MSALPAAVQGGPPTEPIRVSIVVPAYNEGAILRDTLSQLTARFPDAEILVVSDGSTDDTCVVMRSCAAGVRLLEYTPNRGKGYAIRVGVSAARGDVVVFSDADLPFGTAGVERLLKEFDLRPEADVIITEKTGAYRSAAYRGARAAVRLVVRGLLGLDQGDTQAGLKGFRRDAARVIFSQAVINGFAADMEMLAIASREGLRVAAVPLGVVNDDVRPSTFTPRQGMRLLRDVWTIRRRLRSMGVGGGGVRRTSGRERSR